MSHTILLMSLAFYFHVILRVDAIPELQAKRWNSSLGTLVADILDNHFPRCEVILLQDKFFASTMNSWLRHFPHPYYSLTLDDNPVPDYATWNEIKKTAGFTCTTIIAVCLSFSTCRNKDSKALFAMLRKNGILLKDRRALLYVDSETANDSHYVDAINGTIPVKFNIRPLSYQEQDAKVYTIPALNNAKAVLRELNSHITVIRKIDPVRDSPSLKNSKKTIFYETTTFSPNWLPAGTPVLKNIWSTTHGFSFPSPTMLDLNSVRFGGTARVCVSSTDLLPMFYYHEGEALRGVDGEMLKIFVRRFQMSVQIFEPKDNDFGQKQKSGNWTGVIGYVVRKEADFGVGQITYTLDRYLSASLFVWQEGQIFSIFKDPVFFQGLKFTPSFVILTAVAICPPPKLKPRFFMMVQPFDWISWLCLGVITVVIVVILQGMQAISTRLTQQSYARKYYVPWVQMLGPIVQRSVTLTALPRLWATITLMSTWLVTANIISLFYLTILIGALSVPAREPSVTSPYDIIKRNIPCALLPVAHQALVNSTMHYEQMMYRQCVKLSTRAGPGTHSETPDIQASEFMTRMGGCSISEKLRANYLVGQFSKTAEKNDRQDNSASSRMYVSREAIFIGPTGWAMRSDIDFLLENYFDRVFLQFRAQGLLMKTMDDFSLRSTVDVNSDQGTAFRPLALESIEPIFIAALLCFIVSALALGVEILFHKRQMRSKKKRKLVGNPDILT